MTTAIWLLGDSLSFHIQIPDAESKCKVQSSHILEWQVYAETTQRRETWLAANAQFRHQRHSLLTERANAGPVNLNNEWHALGLHSQNQARQSELKPSLSTEASWDTIEDWWISFVVFVVLRISHPLCCSLLHPPSNGNMHFTNTAVCTDTVINWHGDRKRVWPV